MIGNDLLTFVKEQEGLRLDPYLDQAGLPTIGYGHRIPSLDHPPLANEAAAVDLLIQDLQPAQLAALRLVPLAAGRRLDSLTDFVFNAGAGALATSKMRLQANAGDWAGAAATMSLWIHAHHPDGTVFVVPALLHRRKVTAVWLRDG